MKSEFFFLGKNQKIFGPFSGEELAQMKSDGEIVSYSWILKVGETSWSAIDPAPSIIPQFNGATSAAPEIREQAPIAKPLPRAPSPKFQDTRIQEVENDTFRAILFDSRNAVTAWIYKAADHGCEIRADSEGADPLFVDKAGAILNIHEVATGKTTKVYVQVDRVFRRDHHWIYKVRWDTVPAIFEDSRAA